jgi:hypothetical protein
MQLHSYFRSSAAYRVRIALNLKGLQAQQAQIHSMKNGSEQSGETYYRIPGGGLCAGSTAAARRGWTGASALDVPRDRLRHPSNQ